MDKGILAAKQKIKERIEEVGRVMGVPEDVAARIVEIAAIERLTEVFQAQRAEQACHYRENSGLMEVARKCILYLAGLLTSEKKNNK